MPRAKKKTQTAPQEHVNEEVAAENASMAAAETVAEYAHNPDIFDEVIAQAQARMLEQPQLPAPVVHAEVVSNGNGHVEHGHAGNGHAERHEPQEYRTNIERATIITDAAAGARFHYDYTRHKAAVTFDEKPSDDVRAMLKESGYGWNPRESAWEKPIRYDTRALDRLDAKEAFETACEMIRAEKGVGQQVG